MSEPEEPGQHFERLLAGVRGEQIAGRFTLIRTQPFPYGSEWKGLVRTLEGMHAGHSLPTGLTCGFCRTPMDSASAARRWCSHACRQAAYRARKLGGLPATALSRLVEG